MQLCALSQREYTISMADIGAVFRQRLHDRRKAMGLSQSDLAGVLGVAQSYISQIESGRSGPPTVDRAFDLARACETSVDYLIGLTENPAPNADMLPEHALEVLETMRQLDNAQNYELLVIVRALLRERETIQRAQLLDFIEAAADHLGAGEELDRLEELLTSLELGRPRLGRRGRLLPDDAEQPSHHQR